MVKHKEGSPGLLLLGNSSHFAATGGFWAKAVLLLFPIRRGGKPGREGLHAGAPGPSPQEQATFLVGGDSVHMSVGTVPHYFPALPVITMRLGTARQERPRMLLFTTVYRTESLLLTPRFLSRSSNFVETTQAVEIWVFVLLVSSSGDSWSVVSARPWIEHSPFTPTPTPVCCLFIQR